ncbi:DUF1254 domain-containing protein [Bradyrhizobium sp. HKCCYLRH1073]|uniref:DUF1254 domain-containing protein n=1 Tax=unclassified Bradyrhizobium TaxID=2631580 RepID=UPI0028E9D278|nr:MULTISPECIES: DUF1254 domain-containing protein [unclassified Bradyrhizobium]
MNSSAGQEGISLDRRCLLTTALGAGLGTALSSTRSEAAGPLLRALGDLKGDVEEELAYVLALECYVYGFPLVMMDATRAVMTATSKSEQYKAPVNQFGRMRTYVDPDFKDCVRISVNSLWAFSFIDLDKEPFVYSQPDTQGRYIIMQALNMWTDDFASAGSRTTGTGAGNFLIAGPKWNGVAPNGIKQTFRSTTRYASVLVQIACDSPKEFVAINKLQDELQLTPLSAWGKSYTPPSDVPIDTSVDTTATPYDQVRLMTGEMFFKRLAAALKDNPPYPDDAKTIDKLKRIGIEVGKDFEPSKLDPAVLRGINRAPAEVWYKLETGPYTAPTVNGWQGALNIGRFGTDYTTRAFIAWFGLGALTSDDAVYPTAFVDGDGNVLDGAAKYVLHLEKDEIFPSEAGVWSVSPYRENFYVRNAINRYGITSAMPIKYNPDGSLDIYIQAQSPGADKETNWLPCPPSLPFNLSVRVYQPKTALKDGTFKIPPIRRVRDT